jgi:antitoxin component of RelBE/YafQ-DinJ toxin-antitoxin module
MGKAIRGQKDYNLIRTNSNIPKKIRERVDAYADDFGISISSAIVILLKNALDNYEIMQSMKSKKDLNESTN